MNPTHTASAPAFDISCVRERARRLIPVDQDRDRRTPELGDFMLNPELSSALRAKRPRDAAVLVPIVRRDPEVTVLLTRRTDHLAAHAGQIAFPGGKIDPDDDGPVGACLREAEEEISLPPQTVDLLGMGDPYVTGSGFRIFPVVGMIDPGLDLVPNPEEVAEIFEVPLSFLMRAENHHHGKRDWNGGQRRFYVMPYRRHYIWGVTAGIIRTLYDRMYSR